jgi:hypothetical protein
MSDLLGWTAPRSLHRFAGAQQGLRWDACPVGALATDKAAFHDGDAQAALGRRAGAVLPRGATPEDDDVIVTAPFDAAHIDLR